MISLHEILFYLLGPYLNFIFFFFNHNIKRPYSGSDWFQAFLISPGNLLGSFEVCSLNIFWNLFSGIYQHRIVCTCLCCCSVFQASRLVRFGGITKWKWRLPCSFGIWKNIFAWASRFCGIHFVNMFSMSSNNIFLQLQPSVFFFYL